MKIGEVVVVCAVLEGAIRVISGRSFSTAFGRHASGSGTPPQTKGGSVAESGVAKLPTFLGARNLKSFIDTDLIVSLNSPLEYTGKRGGKAIHGYRAELIPRVCDVWLRARDAGVLTQAQMRTAERAYILMRGFAEVGIIALVDEATGYQAVREHDALTKILEAFVAKEIRAWIRTFPPEFYAELFRLRGLSYDGGAKKPQYFGHLTNDLIYSRLAPGVLDELRSRNPVVEDTGRRSATHHQWLTGEIGHPKLRMHLEGVTVVMRLSRNWGEFAWRMNEIYPRLNDTPILRGLSNDEDGVKFASHPDLN